MPETDIKIGGSPQLRQPNPAVKTSSDPEKIKRLAEDYQSSESSTGMSFAALLVFLSFSVLLDLLDLLDLTGIGAVLVLAISLILGAAKYLVLWLFDKGQWRTAREIVGYIAELIPGLGIFPINMISDLLAYIMSHPKFRQKFEQTMAMTEQGKQIYSSLQKVEKLRRQVPVGK